MLPTTAQAIRNAYAATVLPDASAAFLADPASVARFLFLYIPEAF
jgi:hypothetical protein